MSNGLFRSPVHRVVINPERGRFSVTVFYHPDFDECIEPLDELVNEMRPKLYKKVKNYHSIFPQYYHRGKRLIEALKI